jgi:hydrogenase maturation protein HypF
MRRARGYAPEPVDLNFEATGILATGAELSNCFCIGKEQQAILSQHIGDLKNMETYEFFCENISEFSRLYRFSPSMIACDMHPDYLSTQFAMEQNLPVIEVQHHHAHIAAVMAEYNISDPVIGISYDGVGFGTDGKIWGSEVMIADYKTFNRISHFEYIPLPGGDLATKQPWRTALSFLYHTFGKNYRNIDIPFLSIIDLNKADKIIEAIEHKINSPLCCSTGRLFDAVSALMGICIESNYHAEAPLRLENYLTNDVNEVYSFSKSSIVSMKEMITEIVKDIEIKKSPEFIVTRFHNTIAQIALHQVKLANKQSGLNKIVISGGSFQNKYLTEKLVTLLSQNQFEVYYPQEVPCNDGALALGQLAIAAKKKV